MLCSAAMFNFSALGVRPGQATYIVAQASIVDPSCLGRRQYMLIKLMLGRGSRLAS